jgi:hypothetical protein
MSAVQVHAALGRGRGHRHLHGRDDRVRACGGGFLGGVVRALSDDLARARRPRHTSRGASEGREGRRRREPRIGYQVWRTVDPVARGDSGRERSRPGCRRAASRRFGAAIGASARRVNSPSELERAVIRPWPAVLKESSAVSTRRAGSAATQAPQRLRVGACRWANPIAHHGSVGLERDDWCVAVAIAGPAPARQQKRSRRVAVAHARIWANAQVAGPAPAARSTPLLARERTSEPCGQAKPKATAAERFGGPRELVRWAAVAVPPRTDRITPARTRR